MRIAETAMGPVVSTREPMVPTATASRNRPSLSGTNPTRITAPMAHTPRVVQDTKIYGELGQLEATHILANFRAEDRIGVADFDNHERMSATAQKIRFVTEQLGVSMATNLINSTFLTALGILEMSMALDIYEDPPSQSVNRDETS